MEQCRLCGRKSELRRSHLFPKFIFDWLKQTGTGYFRKVVAINRRSQDGPKEALLCGDCEQRFSSAEKYFSENHFHNAIRGDTSLPYDDRLMYFLISVLWRVTQACLPGAREEPNRFLERIEAAEVEWRSFLLCKSSLQRFNHIHLFVFDIGAKAPPYARDLNTYCNRAVDGTFFNNETSCYVYAKFARFLCVAILTPYDESEWINTRVDAGSGVLTIPQELLDRVVGGFIVERANEVWRSKARLTKRQKDAILTNFLANADEFLDSDLGRATMADREAQESFVATMPRVGRNEPCPCGSKIKFKKCHGKLVR